MIDKGDDENQVEDEESFPIKNLKVEVVVQQVEPETY